MAKFIARHWLSSKHYIAEMEDPKCLALVTIDNDGRIVRCVILGLKDKERRTA